jgi:integrase
MAKVTKRNRTYKGKSEARWVVRYTDAGARPREKGGFERKEDAEAYRLRIENELAAGTHTPRSRSKALREAVHAMLKEARTETRPGYYKSLELRAKKYLLPALGGALMVDLTPQRINHFVMELTDRGVSVNAIIDTLKVLRRTTKLAVYEGWVSEDVMKKFTPKLPRQRFKPIDCPTRDEVYTILKKADEMVATNRVPPMARPVLYLATLTGMRAGEIRGLEWSDIDFYDGVESSGLIRVRRSRDQWGNIGPTKSEAGNREIPIGETLVQVLREWKLRQPKNDLDLVITNRWGRAVSGDCFQNVVWKPVLAELGLCETMPSKAAKEGKPGRQIYHRRARYHFHALRHFFASQMMLTHPPKVVQTLIGHSRIEMTLNVYGHIEADDPVRIKAVASIASGLGLK